MKKSKLVKEMAAECGMTQKNTEIALNAILESITEVLAKGEKIQLVGFGTFETKVRKARKCGNPRNPKEIIEVRETIVPKFRPGKSLKEACRN